MSITISNTKRPHIEILFGWCGKHRAKSLFLHQLVRFLQYMLLEHLSTRLTMNFSFHKGPTDGALGMSHAPPPNLHP